MKATTRTEHSAQNTTVAIISRFSAIFMGFIVRIVFTHTLNESYVGVNGLFLDIVNILSLSEMGVGTAITFALYQPIKDKDREKQKALMQLFCRIYRIVAVIVGVSGLCLIPFMDILIKDRPAVAHLTFIYLMYLVNTVSSYLLIYKKTLLDAHQLSYIGTFYQTMSWIIQDVIQIGILYYTHNFILYLFMNLAATVISNLLISHKADRLYPFLKEPVKNPLAKEERQDIFKNVRAMLMHKVGNVVVNNTDNLLISAFVGIVSVGRYSNYYLIIESINQVLQQAFQGIAASVGNLGVSENAIRIRRVFETTFFIGQWVYGFFAIMLYEVINPFVELSFGANYLFDSSIVLVLCISFYITGMRSATLIFRDSLGLFWYDRYKSVVEAALNLFVSLLLVHFWGTAGVFLGTIFSTLATSTWVEPYVLYKHRIHLPSRRYFFRYAVYAAVCAVTWKGIDWLCGLYTGSLLLELCFRVILVTFVFTGMMVLCYHRTEEFLFLQEKIRILMKKRGEQR